jgi:hypothetical protein
MHALPAFLMLPSKKAASFQSSGPPSATAAAMNPWPFDDASNKVREHRICCGWLATREYTQRQRVNTTCYRNTVDVDTLGPLNIRALEIFLGYASPCLMDLFAPKV